MQIDTSQIPDLMSGMLNYGPQGTAVANRLQLGPLNYANPTKMMPTGTGAGGNNWGLSASARLPFQQWGGMPVNNQVYDQLSLGQGRLGQLEQLGKSGLLQQLFSPFNSMGFQASGPDGKVFASAGLGK